MCIPGFTDRPFSQVVARVVAYHFAVHCWDDHVGSKHEAGSSGACPEVEVVKRLPVEWLPDGLIISLAYFRTNLLLLRSANSFISMVSRFRQNS